MDEALTRVSGAELARLMFPRFDTSGEVKKIATGVSASPGAAVGKVVFDSARAVELAAKRRKSDPGPPRDQPGRPARHDRRPGHPDQPRRQDQPRGRGRPRHGQDLRLRCRGTRGGHQGEEVHRARRHHGHRGRRDLHRRHQPAWSTWARSRSSRPRSCATSRASCSPTPTRPTSLIRAVHRIMAHADAKRRLGVQANADTGPDCEPGPPVRRRGRGPGPYRAHVPRRAPPAGRGADPGRHAGAAPARARRPRAAAARRLRGDPGRHGRPAGDDPADRPAAARVPPRPHRPVGQDRPGRRQRHREGQEAARRGAQAARAEPDARPARRPARPGHPRPVRACRSARSRTRPAQLKEAGEDPRPEVDDPARRAPCRRWRSPAS